MSGAATRNADSRFPICCRTNRRLGTCATLGATAAQALLGKSFKVSKQRGELVESSLAPVVIATVHPSSILRAPGDEARHEEAFRGRLEEDRAMTESFRPTLLLSMPQLLDPNFARTVVLLCDYMPDGAFGLVINRPTDEPATAMVRLQPEVVGGNNLPLFIGGPVEPQRGWILLSEPPDEADFRVVVDGVYLSTSPVLLRRVLQARPAPRARVLAGYAGWGPGQLDEELAQSAWLMSDVDVDLVFDVAPAVMWETAIRRLGADPGLLHTSHGVQ